MADEQPTSAEDRREPADDPKASATESANQEAPKSREAMARFARRRPQPEQPAAFASARSGPAGEEVRDVTSRERGRIIAANC